MSKMIVIFFVLVLITFGVENPQSKTEQMLQEKLNQVRSLLNTLVEKYGLPEEERLKLCRRIRNKLIEVATPEFYRKGYIVFPDSEYAYKVEPNCDIIVLKVSSSLGVGESERIIEEARKLAKVGVKEQEGVSLKDFFTIFAYLLLSFSIIYTLFQVIVSLIKADLQGFALYSFLLIFLGFTGWFFLKTF